MIYQVLTDDKCPAMVLSGEDISTAADYMELKKERIDYVVSLQMGYLDFFSRKKRNKEAMACIEYGLVPVHIMMSDFFAPTYEQLKAVINFIRFSGGGVYFHCRRGKDRTGMVRAMYRVIIQGWQLDWAINEMDAWGHSKLPYFWWQWRLKQHIARYKRECMK